MCSHSQNKRGFTLIELLVTTTLGLILMAGSLAAYTSFASRQTKIESARDLQSVLRASRERSRGGDKPDTSCSRLNFYRVWGVQGTQNYYVAVRCDDNDTNLEQAEYTLQSGEYFLDDFEVFFPPLPGPVTGAPATVQIGELDNPNIRYEFTISDQGVVDDGVLINE